MSSIIVDFSKKAKRCYETGEHFKEQKKYKSALEEYYESISYYSTMLSILERNEWYETFRGNYEREFQFQIDCTLFISQITRNIVDCFISLEDYDKALIFLKKTQKIVDALANYQNQIKFSIEDRSYYESYLHLIDDCELFEKFLKEQINEENKKGINEAKELSKGLGELDELFQKMCNSFEGCCSSQAFLVPGKISNSEISSKSDGCFIATAAYSTSAHPDLDTFRNFRDNRLLTNSAGKWLVNLYYKTSPIVAKYVENQPAIKSFVRHQLERLAEWMRHQGNKN